MFAVCPSVCVSVCAGSTLLHLFGAWLFEAVIWHNSSIPSSEYTWLPLSHDYHVTRTAPLLHVCLSFLICLVLCWLVERQTMFKHWCMLCLCVDVYMCDSCHLTEVTILSPVTPVILSPVTPVILSPVSPVILSSCHSGHTPLRESCCCSF